MQDSTLDKNKTLRKRSPMFVYIDIDNDYVD